MGKEYSRILHRMFNARQESDYKEFVQFTREDSADAVKMAEEFLLGIKSLVETGRRNEIA
jgi:uncharacterized protein (UPF0332 family)